MVTAVATIGRPVRWAGEADLVAGADGAGPHVDDRGCATLAGWAAWRRGIAIATASSAQRRQDGTVALSGERLCQDDRACVERPSRTVADRVQVCGIRVAGAARRERKGQVSA